MLPDDPRLLRGTEMLGAGTVINPIIKIVTTVAVLAAAYFFIVKPILDTTNNAVNRSLNAVGEGLGLSHHGVSDHQKSQAKHALVVTDKPQRLEDCLQRAINHGPNQQQIDRCVSRFTP
jgi:hypothetical protein